MSITRFSGKAVVASWELHLGSGVASLCEELPRRFKNSTALHIDIDSICYFRVLVRADEDAADLQAEVSAAILVHQPSAAVDTRVESYETKPRPAADEPKQSIATLTELAALQKRAAEALWHLLDDIDTADDAARDNDTNYRVNARTIAKRRSEYAQSFDGQTLVWSWESLIPWDALSKRVAEAAKTATADNPVFIEVEPEKYDAADCIRIEPEQLPPEFYDVTSAAMEKGLTSEEVVSALEAKGVLKHVDAPPELLKTATIYEAGQPIDSVGALMPEGLAGFEPYRGPIDEHTTEDERVRWCPDAKGEPDASAE